MKTLFTSGNQVGPRLALLAAAANLPMWLNLAHWSATDMRESASGPDDKDPPLAPLLQRISAAALCLATGGAICMGAHMYGARLVRTLSLRNTKQRIIDIETHALWNNKAAVDANSLRCLERIAGNDIQKSKNGSYKDMAKGTGNKVFVVLHNNSTTKNYMLPRDGVFHDPKTFDSLFFRDSFK
ncbi:hypothetical protein HDU98_010864 [Podochytrium sp. JEL0797]|nr:hypothetical protein HDU98_010864 [Podochytrium sp. JEL0797]